MANFPKSDLEIVALGNNVKTGLTAHADVYPDPPVPAATLTSVLTAVQTAMDKVTAARAEAEKATEDKVMLIKTLATMLKKNLHYAEDTVNDNDVQLKLLGWGARKDPTPLEAPGQTGLLMVYPQGEGWLELQWLAPVDGGKVATYQVQRRLKSEAAWTGILTTFERKITLQNQPRGVELEYCIFASNKAGDGPASNTVQVVL
jgi:hypothetical protein